jgi:capsule polysaccharide export protein KpsE/RkpR
MATKEITKQESRYTDPDLEHELVVEAEDAALGRGRTVARVALLWQERRFLCRCAAAGIVISTIIAFLIPVRYTSTTRLMPPDQAGAGMATMLSALTKAGGELGSIGNDLLGIRTSSDLFVGILHSRTIQDELVNKFDLRKVYGDRRWEDARKDLENRTDVSSDRKSGIITIKVSDKSPQRAAEMAREYVAGLDRIVLTLNVSSAHKERVFLEKRLGQVQQDLEAAEKDFGNFASKNTAIDVKEQGKAMIGAAAEVEGQLIAAETQLEGLRQIYNPNNVRIRSLQARIDEFRRQLQKLGGKAESAGSAAPAEDEDQYPSIRALPILGITYADLFRSARVKEVIFETLTKQYELAKVEEARETPSVKVLDEGDIPERKSFPPRLVMILLGTGLVFAFSSVWVLAYARWQEVDPRDPGKILAQQILGTIASKLSRNRKPVLR